MTDRNRTIDYRVTRIVLTVHGIRTFGQWQTRLSRMIRHANSNIVVENFQYGYFSVIAFLIPPLRWLVTVRFRSRVREITKSYPNAEISVVAHSFGTHIVGYGLYGMKPNDRPRAETIILAGSVLRSSFPWGELINAGFVNLVINECGIHDNILLLSQMCVLFTGMAGRLGFYGMTGHRIINRYHSGGHSLYFESAGLPSDHFMETFWVPVLTNGAPPLPHDERTTSGPLQGVVLTLLQIADPIKLLVYAGLSGVVIYFSYYIPHIEARTNEALAAQAEIGRVTTLSRAYFENRGDIPRAVATLSSAISFTSQYNLDNSPQQRMLRFWLQRLEPLQIVVDEIEKPSVFRWSMTDYLAKKGTIRELLANTVVGVFLDDMDHVFLVGNDNVARTVRLSSLTIQRETPLPRSHESISPLTTGRFDKELSKKADVLLRNNGDADLESLNPPVEQIEDNQNKKPSELTLNSVQWQTNAADALSYDSLTYDATSGLVVAFGSTFSHSLGGVKHGMWAIDPFSGQVAGLQYSWIGASGPTCGTFIFDSDDIPFTTQVRLRHRGEGNLLHLSTASQSVSDTSETVPANRGCESSTGTQKIISDLNFPRVISERSLWHVSAKPDNPLVQPSDEVPRYRDNRKNEESNGDQLAEPWRFGSLAEGASAVGWIFQLSFGDRHSQSVAWDPHIYWVEGSDGVKYGYVAVCRLNEGVAQACLRVQCRGTCETASSSKLHLIAVTSYKEFGNDSIYVIDTDKMSLVKLPTTPIGGTFDPKFDDAGRLSTFTTTGEFWVFWDLAKTPQITSTSLTLKPVSDDTPQYAPTVINEDPIALLDETTVARLGRFDQVPKWVSGRLQLPGSGPVVTVALNGGELLVHNNSALRLLDAETGAFLTDPVDFSEFPEIKRSNDPDLDPKTVLSNRVDSAFTGHSDGSISVEIGKMYFVRKAPPSGDHLADAISHIEQYTGIDNRGMQLSRLPQTVVTRKKLARTGR